MSVDDELLKRLGGCKPYARFILRAMMRDAHETHSEAGWFLESLRKRLRMKEETLRKHLAGLEKGGLLERHTLKTGAKGRPPVEYRLTSVVLREVRSQASVRHVELLNGLFSGEVLSVVDRVSIEGRKIPLGKKEGAAERRDRCFPVRRDLSVESRLLFAGLISHADLFGCAQVGMVGLQLYTGMNKKSVSEGIKRLKLLGLIRQQVSGVSCSIFEGVKVDSTYFLNLNAMGDSTSFTIAIHTAGGSSTSLWYRICQDIKLASQLRESADVELKWGTPTRFARLLAGLPEDVIGRIARLLQLMLYQFAAGLLSRHWDRLNSEAGTALDDAELPLLIRRAFRSSLFGQGKEAEEGFEALSNYFCKVATELAHEFRSRLERAGWGQKSMIFCALPPPGRVTVRPDSVLTLMSHPVSEDKESIVMFDARLEQGSFSLEHLLSPDRLYSAGLSSTPLSTLRRKAFQKAELAQRELKGAERVVTADPIKTDQEGEFSER